MLRRVLREGRGPREAVEGRLTGRSEGVFNGPPSKIRDHRPEGGEPGAVPADRNLVIAQGLAKAFRGWQIRPGDPPGQPFFPPDGEP